MSDVVKRTRRYDSPRRRDQAAATRRAILEAAQRVFEAQGYAATPVPTIADEAGVAVKTVYLAFTTKAGILCALWSDRLAGAEADTPVLERAWYLELLDEPDPRRKLQLVARQSRGVKTRSAALMEVIRSAAAVDREIGQLWDDIQQKLLVVVRAVVQQLADGDALAAGLDVDSAVDLLFTLNHPSVWQLLVVGRGWTADQYEGWLAETLTQQLLAPR
jgi:AcrR family transcriptional regulator